MFWNHHYTHTSRIFPDISNRLYPASGFRHMNTKAITVLVSYTDLPITS